ncbi:transferase hexapeptide repeat containing protein [Argonema galeatum]|uniref:transferase hexapeptide repeat containing protein n=1 Tax=Argonema galeatum TaxID=2942762 RepID=UPI00201108DE|nr:transferase hexapeptide repeat containing protein [Argonema galeatum]MCL1465702.1 transferase hexapeptide repeat containing protein [Argonema galeatum A003/A1]
MLNETTIEQRLATIEHTVADLKRRIDSTPTANNWLEKVIGSISDEAAFLEALEYGKSLRYAEEPIDEASE